MSPDNTSEDSAPPGNGLTGFWQELRRRHIIRVASVYAVVAWFVIQIADTTFASFGIPEWAFRFVVIVLLLGFPVSLIIAWALELTPDGIRSTETARRMENVREAPAGHDRKRAWFAIFFAAMLPTAIFGTLALVFYLRGAGEAPVPPAEVAVPVEQSIAVLPLVNLSAIGDNAFFAHGVHEDILTNLSRIDGLKVISRTSVMGYTDSGKNVRDIGTELGARYIVEGSVRRIENHVRVTVQLIDAQQDRHLWASHYDRELVDVFATQSAVAREISNSIHLEIEPDTVGELHGMPTRSVKAYDLYLKARSISRSEPESESSLTRQRELLESAVKEDPAFVEAWGHLNEVLDHSIRTFNGLGWFSPPGADRDQIYRDLRERSRYALNRAVALDPENVETLLALASDSVEEVRDEFQAERRRTIDHILEKYPDNATAWYVLGWWYSQEGEFEAAASAFKKALELDPLHAQIVEGSLLHFRLAGDQDMVTRLFERLAQIAPEKGEDLALGRASPKAELDRIFGKLQRTGDITLVDQLVEEYTRIEGSFPSEIENQFVRVAIWTISNDLEKLLAIPAAPLSSLLEVEGMPDVEAIGLYVSTIGRLMQAQRYYGSVDSARDIARLIVNMEQHPLTHTGHHASRSHAIIAVAHHVLNEPENAQFWLDRLLNDRSESYDAYGLAGFAALAALDADRAVEMILGQEALHPSWNGMDTIAVWHLEFRDLLIHPEMQQYYAEEGKWIDYLAERIPEYRK